jgi:hypothetical protein
MEADARGAGVQVTSPDHIRCTVTGALREVDATIRQVVNGANQLITIECRKRRGRQDVTWIEQLATKRKSIGADKTIAVSASGFSTAAHKIAAAHGIELKATRDLSVADLNPLARLDFVWFSHKVAKLQSVGLRFFRSLEWTLPETGDVDYAFPADTDPDQPVFMNIDEGHSWSINDLWRELQDVTEPFAGIAKGDPPVTRTACFPYPGNVQVLTPDGSKLLGNVFLTAVLSLEVEQITLEQTRKVDYLSSGQNLQRVEFASQRPATEEWRVAMQLPSDAADLGELRTGGSWPTGRTRLLKDDGGS